MPLLLIDIFAVLFSVEAAVLALVTVLGLFVGNKVLHFQVVVGTAVLVQLLLLYRELLLVLLELGQLLAVHLLLAALHTEVSVAVPAQLHVLCVLILLLRVLYVILIVRLALRRLIVILHLRLPIEIQRFLLARILPFSLRIYLHFIFDILQRILSLLLLIVLLFLIVLLHQLRLRLHIKLLVVLHLLSFQYIVMLVCYLTTHGYWLFI